MGFYKLQLYSGFTVEMHRSSTVYTQLIHINFKIKCFYINYGFDFNASYLFTITIIVKEQKQKLIDFFP